jgi:hypothetical protein
MGPLSRRNGDIVVPQGNKSWDRLTGCRFSISSQDQVRAPFTLDHWPRLLGSTNSPTNLELDAPYK